jgi:4-amino-4-deoxy-L-arabinose transferase-like glycosyltransferase
VSSIAVRLPRVRERVRVRRPELLVLLALAAGVYLWSLSRNGYANSYYSAAVRSMSTSWHAFLYGSFDVRGLMTVDKPPLALWVQALSVRAFGFSSWAMLVPQALMGVATVGLGYDLVRRRFGRLGGFVGGLALAITPVFVAIARYNNPDTLLVLCCVAAAWFVVRGLEDGRTRCLVWAGVCVGLGFEAKMGAALLVVPAFAIAWLWVAPRGRLAAVRSLLAGGASMLVVSLAWPVLVWLTPAADRPWVAGTSDNSIWSLILGYNGFGRLLGQSGGPGGGAGPGGAAGPFGGSPGLLRLLNDSLGGQAGWFLGAALVAAIGIAVASRLRRGDPRSGWVIAIGGSFATIALAFSTAKGIFHPYYTSQLAPFAAALVGGGAAMLVRGSRRAALVGAVGIAAAVACEVVVLRNASSGTWWNGPLVALGALAAGALVYGVRDRRARLAVVAATVALFLAAPAAWTVDTLGHSTTGTFPAGGPATQGFGAGGPPGGGFGGAPGGGPGGGGFAAGGGFGGDTSSLAQAVAYARAHGGGTVAVSSQSGAAGSILTSNANVAGIGGFSGRESELTATWLADAVQGGKVRWVIVSQQGPGLPSDARTGAKPAMAAVSATCKPVSSVSGLYDCAGKASALRAS